jgi:site-specific DNA-cytosine methylase
VLVACEFSGRVRQAFRALGHDAWSCDLFEPAEDGSPWHRAGDAVRIAREGGWDLMIAHPPCTHLTNAGARWWADKEQEQAEALEFVRELMDAPIPRIAIENPPGKIGTAIKPATQYIQPWQFGHCETKKTGLWLKGLPLLRSTHNVFDEMMLLPLAVRSRVHWMKPGPDRWKERSRTYEGIARAMAEQWGGDIRNTQPELELEMA